MKKLFFLILTDLLLFHYANAQWTPASGLDGGDVRAFGQNSSYVFAGSQYGGVFRSSNHGDSWEPALHGLPSGVSVTKILATNSVVFAGTSNWTKIAKGIYRSFDNGASWAACNNGINTSGSNTDLSITGITFCGAYLFVSTLDNGVYRSQNQGSDWEHAGSDSLPEYYQVNDICSSGSLLFAGTAYGNGILKSADFGNTWTLINTGLPSGVIVYDLESSGSNLYARTSHGFFWSPSNGDYWITINTGITNPTGAASGAFTVEGSVAFASTYDGTEGPKTYKSSNGGSSWTAIPSMAGYYVQALLINSNYVFAGNIGNYGFASNGGGVVRSIDFGATWAPAITGLSGISCTSFTSGSSDIFAGTRYYSGIFNSSNGGSTWEKTLLPGTTTNYQVLSMISNGSSLFAGINTSGVYISDDNGTTWSSTASIGLPVYALGVNSGYVFAGTSNQGMRRTNNNGSTWTTINTGLTTVAQKTIRAITISNSKIYIGTANGVFKSTNDGNSWVSANGGVGSPGYTFVKAVVAKGDTVFAGCDKGVLRSTNGGSTWTTGTSGLGTGSVYSLLLTGDTIFAGGVPSDVAEGGIFYSTDWGQSWTSLNSTFPCIPEVNTLYIYDNKLFAGTYGIGVWSYDLAPPATKTLTLGNIFIEGLYSGSGQMNQANDESGPHFGTGIADIVTIELHNGSNYSIVDYSATANLSTTGNITLAVPAVHNGNYYITIKHRNSIETTSASPLSFSGSSISYSFNAANKAFGSNLVLMAGGDFAIFSGDVNQDGYVDIGDQSAVETDANNFAGGYLVTDLNGDGYIDITDQTIAETNASAFIGASLP